MSAVGKQKDLFPLVLVGMLLAVALVAIVAISTVLRTAPEIAPPDIQVQNSAGAAIANGNTSFGSYALPYDAILQSSTPHVTSASTCQSGTCNVQVAVLAPNDQHIAAQYVYKTGFYSKTSTDHTKQWIPFNFTEPPHSGTKWIRNSATYTITGLSTTDSEEYIIAFVCRKYTGLGINDFVCGNLATPKWTIQSFPTVSTAQCHDTCTPNSIVCDTTNSKLRKRCEKQANNCYDWSVPADCGNGQLCVPSSTLGDSCQNPTCSGTIGFCAAAQPANTDTVNAGTCLTGSCYKCKSSYTQSGTTCVAACAPACTVGATQCGFGSCNYGGFGVGAAVIMTCQNVNGCPAWVKTDDCACRGCSSDTGQCNAVCNGCTEGTACFTNGANRPSNPCQICAGSSWINKADDVACTGGTCSAGTCVPTPSCGTCVDTDGACIANGAAQPSNPCQKCSGTTWTNNDGVSCSDFTDGVCAGGTCTPPPQCTTCLDDTTCVANNAVRPSNQCQTCSGTDWTNKTDGTACAGGTCVKGTCTPGPTCTSCMENGVCVANNAVRPSNSCQQCAATGSAWVNKKNYLSCSSTGDICWNGVCSDNTVACQGKNPCVCSTQLMNALRGWPINMNTPKLPATPDLMFHSGGSENIPVVCVAAAYVGKQNPSYYRQWLNDYFDWQVQNDLMGSELLSPHYMHIIASSVIAVQVKARQYGDTALADKAAKWDRAFMAITALGSLDVNAPTYIAQVHGVDTTQQVNKYWGGLMSPLPGERTISDQYGTFGLQEFIAYAANIMPRGKWDYPGSNGMTVVMMAGKVPLKSNNFIPQNAVVPASTFGLSDADRDALKTMITTGQGFNDIAAMVGDFKPRLENPVTFYRTDQGVMTYFGTWAVGSQENPTATQINSNKPPTFAGRILKNGEMRILKPSRDTKLEWHGGTSWREESPGQYNRVCATAIDPADQSFIKDCLDLPGGNVILIAEWSQEHGLRKLN